MRKAAARLQAAVVLEHDWASTHRRLRKELAESGLRVLAGAPPRQRASNAATSPGSYVVLLYVDSPGQPCPRLLREVAGRHPGRPVLALADWPLEAAARSRALGVAACLPRHARPATIRAAVTALATGDAPAGASSRDPKLTPRESEVLLLTAEGLKRGEIARALRISPRTVEAHRANILGKLGLRGIAALVRYAIEERLLASRSRPA